MSEPWLSITLSGRVVGHWRTREQAQRVFERPFWSGRHMVKHSKTGEAWVRRRGSWIKIANAKGEPTEAG